jgi:DNA-binding SARP family transcriptional activator/tetratricopeptide (TPR) repeat protein
MWLTSRVVVEWISTDGATGLASPAHHRMRNTVLVPRDEVAVRVLGPVQLLGVGGDVIELPSAAQRRLLGVLAIHAPTPVRAEYLCSVLDVTSGALRTSVSRLRRLVGDEALRTTVGGYRLDVRVDADLACAELKVADGDPVRIARALDRWVGDALEEFADEPWAVGEAVRLGAIRAAAIEDLGEALLLDRRPDEALAVLEPHIVEHPHRDRPRGLAIRALAASGRQTDALRAFQRYRDELAETVGTEPSAELREIDRRVAAGWDGSDDRTSVAGAGSVDPTPPHVSPPLHEVLAAVPTSVGRCRELTILADAAEQARHQGVRAVLVSGGAGIGKTTLLATFARQASGWDVFYGRCDEHVVVPFHPFQSLVGRVVDTLPSPSLMAHTAACGGDLLRLVPYVASRVGLSAPSPGDDGTDRQRMFDAVLDIVERAAAVAPLVLMLDDLHWAEPAAPRLLRYLLENLGTAPVLFVLGSRDPAEVDTAITDAAPELARIDLTGLDEIELGALVHERLAEAAGRDVGPVVARLHTETAGNPLFAEHLLRHWIDTRQIAIHHDVVAPIPSTAQELSPVLRDIVWHRVAALGPEAQPVLTAAAVFGVQFNQQVLAKMTDLPDEKVAALLGRAVAAGILADHPSLSGNVRFTHALVARALEAELGDRATTTLHAQAFEAMVAAQVTPPVELAPQLARHAELGGLLDEAQRWATAAGELALSHLAPSEAVRWFGTALDHASTLGRPDAERADLLVRLGEAATRAGDPRALETIRRGAELAEACGADATLIRAALATTRGSLRSLWAGEQLAIVEAAVARAEGTDLATRARLTALLAQSLGHTGETDRRQAAALGALELARASLDPTLLVRVAPDVLYALWTPGAAATRAELAAEATAIADEGGDPHLAFVVHHVAYGAAVCVGDARTAARYLERLHDIADEIGEPLMRWHVGILDAHVATMEARFADAERIASETLELGMEIGDPDAFGVFAAQFFFFATFAGRHAELLPVVQQMMDTDPHVEPLFRAGHALVCCEVGRPEVGQALLRDAMAEGLAAISQDWLGSTTLIAHAVLAIELDDLVAAEWLFPAIAPMAGEVSFNGVTSQGPVSAYVGKLASLLGRYDDAERHLLDALATTEAFGWEYHRATTLIALAQNRLRATATLDAAGESWLSNAEELCATYGIASWGARAAGLRKRLPTR